MSKGRANHFYKHGRCTGYSEFRYGSTGNQAVYNPLKGKRRYRMNADKRKHLVCEITKIMRNWRFTPFENEGACRSGLRSAMCLSGSSWALADQEAQSIVEEALTVMRATRPTLVQGQREYSVPRENCAWCYGEIDSESVNQGHRFCSEYCASMSKLRSNEYHSFAMQHRRARAFKLLVKAKSQSKNCSHCGSSFKSHDENARYCSHPCFLRHVQAKTQTKICLWCAKSFYAGSSRAKFCSAACTEGYGRLKRGAPPPKRITAPVFDFYLYQPQ